MEEKKLLKHCLKRKMSYSLSLFVIFMMTGSALSAAVDEAEFEKMKKELEYLKKYAIVVTGEVKDTVSGEYTNNNPIDINKKGRNMVVIGNNTLGHEGINYDTTIIGNNNISKNFYVKPKSVKPEDIEEFHQVGVTVIGSKNIANSGVVIGRDNIALTDGAVILGESIKSLGGQRHVNIGSYSTTQGVDAIAMGFAAKAMETSAISLGAYSEAKGVGGVALGNGAIAAGEGVALGYKALANRQRGELGYYPHLKADPKNKDEVAKALGKEEEYNGVKKIFADTAKLQEKVKEHYDLIVKLNELDLSMDNASVDLYKYNKGTTEYDKAMKKLQELKIEYNEVEAKEEALRNTVSSTNPEFVKLQRARITENNIFGEHMSTADAVSVGNEQSGIYRQITGVAAGSKDTDAVNVAQLKSLDKKVNENSENIASNKADIATNKTDIQTNKDAIATNKTNIQTNKDNIATNKTDIQTNKDAIATNKTDIQTNKDGIATNKTDIQTNKDAIATNKTDIATNKDNIATNKTAIDKNTSAITETRNEISSIKKISTDVVDQVTENKDKIEKTTTEVSKNKEEISKNKEEIAKHQGQIDKNTENISNIATNNDKIKNQVSENSKRIDSLDSKVNKGMSLMAAMTAIDFQDIEVGEVGIGAGLGHFQNSQGVAVGVAYSPTENFKINAKYSVSTSDIKTSAVGIGGVYKFKVGR